MKLHSIVLSTNAFAIALGQAQQALEITQNVNSSEKSVYSTSIVSKTYTNLAVSSNVPVSILKCDSKDNNVCPHKDDVIVYMKSVCDDPDEALSDPVVFFSSESVSGEARLAIDMNHISEDVQDLLPVSTFAAHYEATDPTCVSRCSQEEEQQEPGRRTQGDADPNPGPGSYFNDPSATGESNQEGTEPNTGGGMVYDGEQTSAAATSNSEPVSGPGSYFDGGGSAAESNQEGTEPNTGGGMVYDGEQKGGETSAAATGNSDDEPQTSDGGMYWDPNAAAGSGTGEPETGGGVYFVAGTNFPSMAPPPVGGGMYNEPETSGSTQQTGDGAGTDLNGDMVEPQTGDGMFWNVNQPEEIGPVFTFPTEDGAPLQNPNSDVTSPAFDTGSLHNIQETIPDDALLNAVTEGVGIANTLGTNLDVDEEAILLPELDREDCENSGRKAKAVLAKGILKNLRAKVQQKQCQVTAEILVNSDNKSVTVTAPMLQVYDNSNVIEDFAKFGGEDDCLGKCTYEKYVTITYPDDAIVTIRDNVESYVIL